MSDGEEFILAPGDGYIVAWTPDDRLGQEGRHLVGVQVGRHPDSNGWSLRYELTESFEAGSKGESVRLRDMALKLLFDGCAPSDVLREFSHIPAWRKMRLEGGHWAFIPGRWREWNPHNDPETDHYWKASET